MSLIRHFTRLPDGKKSGVYAWHDTSGYFCFTVAEDDKRRLLDPKKSGLAGIRMTRAEFQYVVQQAIRQYGWKAPRRKAPRP